MTSHKNRPPKPPFAPVTNDQEDEPGATPQPMVVVAASRAAARQQTIESVAVLRALLAAAPVGLGFLDCDLRYVLVNDRLAAINGVPPAETIGRTVAEVIPQLAPVIEPPLRRVLRTGEPLRNLELSGETPATRGEKHHWIVNYSPVRTEEGKLIGVGVTITDITERKRMEDVLRENEERLSAILQSTPAVIYLMSTANRFVHINRRFEELFDLRSEEIRGKSIYEVFPCEVAAVLEANNREVIAKRAPIEFEETVPHRDGVHTYTSIKSPLLNAAGEPRGIVGVSTDITERKQAEEALQEHSARLTLLSDTANALLLSDDPHELISKLFEKLSLLLNLEIYFNYLVVEEGRRMRLDSYSGVPDAVAEEIMWLEYGQAVCGHVARERRPIVAEDIQNSTEAQTQLVRSLGITAYASYPLLAHDKLIGTLSFGTRRRNSFFPDELALMETICNQVAVALDRTRLIAALKQRAEELAEADRLKDEFLATLSHELRTPLTAVLGWANILCEGPPNEAAAARAAQVIKRNAEAQKQLIEEMLDVSRIITGKLRVEVRPIKLIPIIEAAVESVRPAIEAKDIRVSMHLDARAKRIAGDPDRLRQIVWNLLSNAVKFTPRGGRVEVRLERAGAHVRIIISDTGQGISPDFLPHVFDRFRQADQTTSREHSGLGLGLAVVRHLTELHGGTVTATSNGDGKGATFTVELPTAPPRSGAGAGRRRNSARGRNRAAADHPSVLDEIRVLVIDDASDAREILSVVLNRHGAEVLTASSASEGLDLIRRARPDVLVCDIGMPKEDGYALIKKVRGLSPEQGGATPAVALTAYTGTRDREDALRAGYQEHIGKPAGPAELAGVISRLVAGQHKKRKSVGITNGGAGRTTAAS